MSGRWQEAEYAERRQEMVAQVMAMAEEGKIHRRETCSAG